MAKKLEFHQRLIDSIYNRRTEEISITEGYAPSRTAGKYDQQKCAEFVKNFSGVTFPKKVDDSSGGV